MKTFLILLLSCSSVLASDWNIHAAFGLNPWLNFQKVSPDGLSIQVESFTYGTDQTFSTNVDEWLISDGLSWSVYTNGSTVSVSSDWITTEIPYNPNYGTSSYLFWFIEGGAPDFMGGSSAIAPSIPGEYWVDFNSTGTIRISSVQPSDFGKWAWDGSVNPDYIAPMLTRKHHGKK